MTDPSANTTDRHDAIGGAVIERLDADTFEHAIPGLAAVLRDAVDDGASVGFLAGLSHDDAVAWWRARAAAVKDGSLAVWVAREPFPPATPQTTEEQAPGPPPEATRAEQPSGSALAPGSAETTSSLQATRSGQPPSSALAAGSPEATGSLQATRSGQPPSSALAAGLAEAIGSLHATHSGQPSGSALGSPEAVGSLQATHSGQPSSSALAPGSAEAIGPLHATHSGQPSSSALAPGSAEAIGSPHATRPGQPSSSARAVGLASGPGGRIVGTVSLVYPEKENSRHRAELIKLAVLRSQRGLGLGRRLLATAEESAATSGISLLMLDTETASDAESLYRRAGWQRYGIVPGYAADPAGVVRDCSFYFKQLG